MDQTILIIVILALIAQAGAFHKNISNCTEEFHATIKKAVEIKNHCNIRGFYDCCQVIKLWGVTSYVLVLEVFHYNTVKWHFYVRVLFYLQVKCWLPKSVLNNFFYCINGPYIPMHEMLEFTNKNCINIAIWWICIIFSGTQKSQKKKFSSQPL